MRNNNNTISGNLYIRLQPMTANINCRLESLQGILGVYLVEAAMGGELR